MSDGEWSVISERLELQEGLVEGIGCDFVTEASTGWKYKKQSYDFAFGRVEFEHHTFPEAPSTWGQTLVSSSVFP